MITCRSSVGVDLWEVGDEEIKIIFHQCSHNLKAASIINTNDLFKRVTQFILSASGELLEGYELGSPGHADK